MKGFQYRMRISAGCLMALLATLALSINPRAVSSEQSGLRYDMSQLEDTVKYRVILMAGQSNMVGVGSVADLSEHEKTLPDSVIYHNYGMGPNMKPRPQYFGPEVTLSKNLVKVYPNEKLVLIKYAVGASSMYNWAPNYNRKGAKSTGSSKYGSLYEQLLVTVEKIISGKNAEIVALLWQQGEKDARVAVASRDFYDNFKSFITSIRKDLSHPELPIIFGRVNPPKDKFKEADTVRDAQFKIASEISNVILINTDSLSKLDDRLHYNTAGQMKLGELFASEIIKLKLLR